MILRAGKENKHIDQVIKDLISGVISFPILYALAVEYRELKRKEILFEELKQRRSG